MTLRELRESKYRAQVDVASALHVTVTSVSNWERGVQNPRLTQIREMAEYFGVDPDVVAQAVRESQQQAKS